VAISAGHGIVRSKKSDLASGLPEAQASPAHTIEHAIDPDIMNPGYQLNFTKDS
jgi:hypothetical protein